MVAMVAITWSQILCRGCQSVKPCLSVHLSACVCVRVYVRLNTRATVSALGHRLFSFMADQSVPEVTNRACPCLSLGGLDDIVIDYIQSGVLLALQSVLMLLKTQHNVARMQILLKY